MPQPPIPEFWRNRIKAHLAQIEQRKEKPSDTRIRRVLEKEAEALTKGGSPQERAIVDRVPSQRTISRIRTEEWPQVERKDRERYRSFYWPESMERGDLPWEASGAALELLREGDKLLRKAWQPYIRSVRFFWHVTQVAPKAPFWLRLGAAWVLMEAESEDDTELERAVQWFLAYQPWDESWAGTYAAAIQRSSNPIPAVPEDFMPLYRISGPDLSEDEFLALVRKRKLEWLDQFGSESPDLSEEEQNG